MGITVELAKFIAGLNASEIPAEVLHQAKRCLIDWLGVTLAGSADPSAAVLCAVADDLDAGPHATILGRDRGASLLVAVLINGYTSHVLDYDDTYNPERTTVHGSAPVWPVVIGLSESRSVNGEQALAAFVAGFETEVRIALAAGPAHYEAGWHVTGTVGHFGAAAAAAQVLQLGPDAVANALGAAGTQAAGLKAVYGSMGKALHPGKAAMDGLLASLLADKGFTATDSILEAERGFLRVLSPAPDPELVTKDLGRQWTLLDDGFKPYACGSLTHPTIEGVIHLRREHELMPDQIESIEATVNDYVSWVTAKKEPTTGLQGKFSIYHCAAVAALDGSASMRQFEDERVNDSDVIEMRGRVSIVVDDSLPKDAASVALTLIDGRRLTYEVMHNKGTAEKPMIDSEIEEKFLDLAEPRIGPHAAREVATECWRLEDLGDFGAIARLCRGRSQ
ncbi:MAG: MmgE/PrpD family protein [Actinomycetota bacterium]